MSLMSPVNVFEKESFNKKKKRINSISKTENLPLNAQNSFNSKPNYSFNFESFLNDRKK